MGKMRNFMELINQGNKESVERLLQIIDLIAGGGGGKNQF
jgi:hypothetical protein